MFENFDEARYCGAQTSSMHQPDGPKDSQIDCNALAKNLADFVASYNLPLHRLFRIATPKGGENPCFRLRAS